MSMTHEEAARILDPETSREALYEIEYYGGFRGDEAVLEAVNDACRIAADVLRNLQPDCNKLQLDCKPLTMEQLREMDGKPMWVERNEEPYDGKWFIVDHADVENPDKTLYTKEGVTYSDYGKYFTAYAYTPAHIDLEEWTAEWIYPENEWNLPKCSKCGCNSKDAQYGHKNNFCPKCGRAMTPEAWAEREKRLRG